MVDHLSHPYVLLDQASAPGPATAVAVVIVAATEVSAPTLPIKRSESRGAHRDAGGELLHPCAETRLSIAAATATGDPRLVVDDEDANPGQAVAVAIAVSSDPVDERDGDESGNNHRLCTLLYCLSCPLWPVWWLLKRLASCVACCLGPDRCYPRLWTEDQEHDDLHDVCCGLLQLLCRDGDGFVLSLGGCSVSHSTFAFALACCAMVWTDRFWMPEYGYGYDRVLVAYITYVGAFAAPVVAHLLLYNLSATPAGACTRVSDRYLARCECITAAPYLCCMCACSAPVTDRSIYACCVAAYPNAFVALAALSGLGFLVRPNVTHAGDNAIGIAAIPGTNAGAFCWSLVIAVLALVAIAVAFWVIVGVCLLVYGAYLRSANLSRRYRNLPQPDGEYCTDAWFEAWRFHCGCDCCA
jgi:hypothetical protein